MSKPLVSVLTPTYNRRRFIPALIECFKQQDYPADRIEWIILDDGKDKVSDLFESIGLDNIRYYREEKKLTIGAKRNRLNQLAAGDILVCMDDDDYYPPQRISHVVDTLEANPSFQICGSSELYLYFTDDKSIFKIGPYGVGHATNGTLAYRRVYLEGHTHDETVKSGEESSFLNNFTEPMVQLEPHKVVLLISHSENTFDKRQLRLKETPVFKQTPFSLRQFIKNERLYTLYNNI
jgi:glycosyltransferase involved in cell wall biosynthesis